MSAELPDPSRASRSDAIERLLAPARRYRTLATPGPESLDSLDTAGVDGDWLAEHLRALALRFAAPLLERRHAAAPLTWPDLQEVYRSEGLSEEIARVVAAVSDQNRAEYARIAGERIQRRRLRLRGARAARLSAAEQRGLARRVARPADPLYAAVQALARAPEPDSWETARIALEQAWATAWEAMAIEIIREWEGEFAPRLVRLERLRRGAPRWALGAALALAAALAFLGAATLLR